MLLSFTLPRLTEIYPIISLWSIPDSLSSSVLQLVSKLQDLLKTCELLVSRLASDSNNNQKSTFQVSELFVRRGWVGVGGGVSLVGRVVGTS